MGTTMILTQEQIDMRRVVCACIIFEVSPSAWTDQTRDDNIVYCVNPDMHNNLHIKVLGARHWDGLMRSRVIDLKTMYHDVKELEQGFIDQFGKFLSRSEALEIAKKQNQIIDYSACTQTELFSEALY